MDLKNALEWNGQRITRIDDIIDTGLSLASDGERKEFIECVRKTGPHTLSNIGYWAGYYSKEKAKKILQVFETSHPIFGATWPDEKLSTEQIFELGKRYGEQAKNQAHVK